MLNKKFRTAKKGWFSSMGFSVGIGCNRRLEHLASRGDSWPVLEKYNLAEHITNKKVGRSSSMYVKRWRAYWDLVGEIWHKEKINFYLKKFNKSTWVYEYKFVMWRTPTYFGNSCGLLQGGMNKNTATIIMCRSKSTDKTFIQFLLSSQLRQYVTDRYKILEDKM